MKTLSMRAFGVTVFAIAGLTVGCGGAPEDMTAPEGEAPVQAPATQEGTDNRVQAKYLRYQCGAQTASLRDVPGGTPIAQVYTGQAIDVYGVSGAWFYAYHPASGLFGYTLSTYYCS